MMRSWAETMTSDLSQLEGVIQAHVEQQQQHVGSLHQHLEHVQQQYNDKNKVGWQIRVPRLWDILQYHFYATTSNRLIFFLVCLSICPSVFASF